MFPTDRNAVAFEDNAEGFAGRFAVREMAEIIHPREGCEVLAVYAEDFYKGTPAVTRNRYGKGGLLPSMPPVPTMPLWICCTTVL